MNYDDTLKFLYSQLPMYQRVGAPAFKKGLGNTRKLLKALGNPERAYPKIHIAGTNGKGTVSHMLAACYEASGRKVGLYTSPHYKDFRERFKINGQMVSKRQVSRFVEDNRAIINEVQPSFFEITVAMAFEFFRQEVVDIAIIETGLGGRLDSTNVIKPLISVITNISFDHMEMLGDTIPKIATEKAGIIKRGVPVVVGEWGKESAPVFKDTATRKKAPLSYADRNLKVNVTGQTGLQTEFRLDGRNTAGIRNLRLPGGSPFLGRNLGTALWAILKVNALYPALTLSTRNLRFGLENFDSISTYIGRWQVLGTEPLVLVDSAHNEAALQEVISRLEMLHYSQLHLVLGFVREKEVEKVLSMFPENASYYFCRPDVPRGKHVDEVMQIANEIGLDGRKYASVKRALAAAKRKAGANDLIFIGGSSFVVAEVI